MLRFSAVVLVVLLGVTACGEPTTTTDSVAGQADSGNTSEAPATSTTATPVTTTTVAPIAAEYGAPVVSGAPLPPVGDALDPATGVRSPVAVGADYEGVEVAIGNTGTAQAVLFVAHWCSHCQDELPEVVDWLDTTGGVDGVEFVLVTVAVDPNRANFPPSAWIAREGWKESVLLDDVENTAFFAFGGNEIPFWVFLNADGTVATRVSGGMDGAEVAAIVADLAIAP